MPDLPQLFVHGDVLERLLDVRPRPWEVGGWLLGWWAEDRSAAFVTHATAPASRGTPFGVTISGDGHRAHFDAAWGASGGHVTFLGDWHTHPGGPPLPSRRDEVAAARIAEDEDFGAPEPLIAIAATGRWPWSRTLGTLRFYVRIGGELRSLDAQQVETLPPVAAAVPLLGW